MASPFFPRLNRFSITPFALLLVVTLTQPLLDGGFGCIHFGIGAEWKFKFHN